MICDACADWMRPAVDFTAQTVSCPTCGHVAPHRFLPLWIVTGPSGAGKTAVASELQRLLPDWDVFETDILWDSAHDWATVKCNWLRIVHHLAQIDRPCILCGTVRPEELAHCDAVDCFTEIHWLALVCKPGVLTARLKARPPWRGCDDAFVGAALDYLGSLREQADRKIGPALTLLDTSRSSAYQTACRVRDWAASRWDVQRGRA